MPTIDQVNASAVPAAARATATGTTNGFGPAMQAIVQRRYGTPDVLALETIARPVPGADDVLIRVYAACASIGDHHVVTGKR